MDAACLGGGFTVLESAVLMRGGATLTNQTRRTVPGIAIFASYPSHENRTARHSHHVVCAGFLRKPPVGRQPKVARVTVGINLNAC